MSSAPAWATCRCSWASASSSMTRRPPRHGLAVTRWHDGATTVPGQPGVYERDIPLAPYSFYTGKHWCHSAQTPSAPSDSSSSSPSRKTRPGAAWPRSRKP